MKVLTLWQPFATAIALGLKKYETRSWAMKIPVPDLFTEEHGIKLAIHASVKPLSKEYQELANKYNMDNLDFGKIIAICDIEECILMTQDIIAQQSQIEKDFGDWCPGRYAWKLSNVQPLDRPIPAKGHQGLWNFDI